MADRGALPQQLSRFFGRDVECRELLDEVRQRRLVTLVGAPGSGKSRLSIEVAFRAAADFPGGIRFVELAPVRRDHVAPAVALALGMGENPDLPIEERLVGYLSGRQRLLVVLDNCEHVVEAVAQLARHLLDSAPAVCMLATSRVALGLAGEKVWTVRPLDGPTSIELFVDRALMLTHDLVVGGADEATLASICGRLDGLPLALELVAAATRVLSFEEIACRLEAGLPRETGRWLGVDARHETMRNAVEWSVRLLPADVQRLFSWLSVFHGAFDLEASEALAGAECVEPQEVLAGLTVLVDHSLVEPLPWSEGKPRRFRLLEPVRHHAHARLEAAGEGDSARLRHAEHFLALARRAEPFGFRGSPPTVGFARLLENRSNLLAAFDWARSRPSDLGLQLCEALADFWMHDGRTDDARRWLREQLAAGTDDPEVRAGALLAAALLARRQGDYADAHTRLDECLETATRSDLDGWWAASVAATRAILLRADNRSTSGLFEEGIAGLRACGDQVGALHAMHHLGWITYVAGDVAGGNAILRAVLAENHAVGSQTVSAEAHLGLAYGASLAGDLYAMREHYVAALDAIAAGGVVDEHDWLSVVSLFVGLEGRHEAAARIFGGSQARRQRRGTRLAMQLEDHSRDVTFRLISEVDGSVFQRLVIEGSRMTIDELRAEALGDTARDGESGVLTRREHQVALLVGEGDTNVQIAAKLVISPRTVESHIENIRRKLGLRNRHELVVWTLRELHQFSP